MFSSYLKQGSVVSRFMFCSCNWSTAPSSFFFFYLSVSSVYIIPVFSAIHNLLVSLGDLTQRLCTAAEIKFYFSGFYESGSKSTNYLKPNKNCNLTSWVSGCEPGWACSAGANEKVDLKNVKQMPARTFDCSPCCEGFFCPHGITCMIRK